MANALSEAALHALCDKYREIKRLRIEHAAGESTDPRPRLRALAARFPGALRELDQLPMTEVEQRLQHLLDALAGRTPAPAWAALQLGYHAWMRAALQVRHLAHGCDQGDIDAVLTQLSQNYVPPPHGPSVHQLDRAAVCAIVNPQGGRLNPWVFARVAAETGVDPEAVREALFLR